MALWGNKDSKTASGTITIATNGAVTGTSTLFTTEAKVGNYIRAGGVDHVIVAIASNTALTVKSAINGGAIAEETSGVVYTLSEKCAFVALAESSGSASGVHGDANKVFGVDAVEANQAASKGQGVAHAGWVRRITGSGGRAGRVITEVLVAGGSITGDQADDDQFPDRTITITAQPQNSAELAGTEVTFSVTASVSPTNTLVFLWQVSEDAGATFTTAPGTNNAASYVIADNTALDGNQYRVNVSSVGALSVTSNAATLTVTPAE